MAERLCSQEVARSRAVRVCHGAEDPRMKLRFIPSETGSRREISATEVRRALALGLESVMVDGVPEALEKTICSYALNPDMLVEFCTEPVKDHSPAAMIAWNNAREAQVRKRELFSEFDQEPSRYWPGPSGFMVI
ncbi:hypothetical protein H2200_013184 [Cladophialophora chaetospira]|uniref:Uncharacterized protein n=1 Tax=Cladophialophora chaetospira TaxID=386627 RepID=A0AA39CBH8_9EURO|nr:hypothetical protein H2200_013184 [Cladophialophora chaetospira]